MTFEEFCEKEFVNKNNEAVIKLLRKFWDAAYSEALAYTWDNEDERSNPL